jgi:hypothetical protein
MSHTILTFITRVTPERHDELQGVLERVQASVPDGPDLPFSALKRLHFASLVLFEDEEFGPYLVFEHNFDGPLEEYLTDLYSHAGECLHQIYRCCEGYTDSDPRDREQIIAYLRHHVIRPNAYHIGNVGRTADQIQRERALRDGLEEVLDGWVQNGQTNVAPEAIRRQLQATVSARPEGSWALKQQPRQTPAEKIEPWLKIGAVAVGGLALLRVAWRWLLPAAAAWVVILRWKEMTDPSDPGLAPTAKIQQLTSREDQILQNHLASLIHVKPGLFRRATLRVVLWATNLIARTATHGKLSGIPSIHFAHWSLIDNGRRLLFLSNYDGSWENYLDDFIDKASTGLTGIWTNTVYFPRTWFLICGGARDGIRFKAWARQAQTYTAAHYSAYKDLTVQAIDRNSAIRDGLSGELQEPAIREWLRLF